MTTFAATPTEFRLRYWTHTAIFALGFWAPWSGWLGLQRGSLWLLAAVELDRSRIATLSSATIGLLVFGIACATLAAWLRTWGAAYIGSAIVQQGTLHAAEVLSAGPFRHLRNPLYAGTFLHTLALALLMPASGALFSVIAIAVVQIRLLLAEEAFLATRLGDAYTAYRARVPRLLPTLRPLQPTPGPATGPTPRWPQAFTGEIYFWGTALSFAALGWRYNASLILQGVVVSLGLSLVARGLETKK